MGHSHRRYFCCCIPTRIAVLILSALTLAGCIVNGWAIGNTLRSFDSSSSSSSSSNGTGRGETWYSLPTGSKAILIADAVVVGLLGLSAIAGLVGALIRNRRLVGLYSFALWILFVAGLVLGSLAIWVGYRDKAAWVQACIDNSSGVDLEDMCAKAWKPALIITIIVFAVIKLIQAYLCVIVTRYKHQLDAEHTERAHFQNSNNYAAAPFGVVGNRSAGGAYVPVVDVEKNGGAGGHTHAYSHSQSSYPQQQPYGTPQYHHS
ncbi:hypothetical protein OC835_007017 [Tilletia horrida]|nr:hypothetical protein OC835_007017 [Tilletia horrida]